jgi:hypothetical protein
MENTFTKSMTENSDEKLIEILSNRNKYQNIALDAAINEAIKRKIIENKSDLETKYPTNVFNENRNEDNDLAIKREKAKNDMIYGAIWCIGGILLTIADIGFIFWGAILFGGIQFFRGLANSN